MPKFALHKAHLVPFVASLINLVFYIIFVREKIIQTDQEFFLALILLASTWCLFNFISLVFSFTHWPKTQALSLLTLLALNYILVSYQWVRGAPLDFALVYNNFSEMISSDGSSQILSSGGFWLFLFLFALIFVGILGEKKYSLLSANRHNTRLRLRLFVVFALMNFGFYSFVPNNPNQLFAFTRSTLIYFRNPDDSLLPH